MLLSRNSGAKVGLFLGTGKTTGIFHPQMTQMTRILFYIFSTYDKYVGKAP